MKDAPETAALIKELSVPRRFLLVEDDADFVRVLQAMAVGFNCTFDVATTGDEALNCCLKIDGYDFIWLDLKLGVSDSGVEVFKSIKAVSRKKPVLVVSGFLTTDNMMAISRVGLAFFLVKPQFFTMEVVEELFSLIGIQRVNKPLLV